MAVEENWSAVTAADEAAELSSEYAAVAASVRRAREDVAELAERAGADRRCVEDVRLAMSEAATNVVMHAYDREEAGTFRVLATVEGDHMHVIVEDDGCGLSRPARTPGLGAGLRVMQQVAERAVFDERDHGGSTVQLSFALRG